MFTISFQRCVVWCLAGSRKTDASVRILSTASFRRYNSVPTSGDKGPGKNYRKKLKKESNKTLALTGGTRDTGGAVGIEGARDTAEARDTGGARDTAEASESSALNNVTNPVKKTADVLTRMNTDTLLEQLKKLESNHGKITSSTSPHGGPSARESPGLKPELKEILSGIKTYIPSETHQRKRFAMPEKKELVKTFRPALKGKTSEQRFTIMDPTGPRLGVFQLPGPTTKVLSHHKPTLFEVDFSNQLASLMAMKSKSQFELLMTSPYQDIYPIDNDTFYKEEDKVGFEEHVLLNHLLDGFPKRGPVRHFMELVVTGLSKNPYYSVQEKRDVVAWYKNYFTQFTPEELQSTQTVSESGST